MPPKKPADAAGRGKKAYEKAPELPVGTILNDSMKKQWKLGKAFATGGFGQIYEASMVNGTGVPFVAKVEPAENGPLFQEIHIYQRIAKQDLLDRWCQERNLKFLGISPYIGSGTHERHDVRFRFLIMPKYETDLEKLREAAKDGKLPPATVFGIALTCVNALEYLHENQIVHSDLKAENLLVKNSGKDLSLVYLVDYGLARRLSETTQYKEQKNKAHDGTLVFTSLDAHKGCLPSYRGDVEILAYNILYWLTGSLPWFNDQANPEKVRLAKEKLFVNTEKFVCFHYGNDAKKWPYFEELVKILDYCASLEYADRPDYNYFRTTLDQALQKVKSGAGKKAAASSSSRKKRTFAEDSTASESSGADETAVAGGSKAPAAVATKASFSANKRSRPSIDEAEESIATILVATPKSAKREVPTSSSASRSRGAVPKSPANGKAEQRDNAAIAGSSAPATPSRNIPGLANMKINAVAASAKTAAVRQPSATTSSIIPGKMTTKNGPTVIIKADGSQVIIPTAVKHRRSMETVLVNKYLRRKSGVVKPLAAAKSTAGTSSSGTARASRAQTRAAKQTGKTNGLLAVKEEEYMEVKDTSSQTSPWLWNNRAALSKAKK